MNGNEFEAEEFAEEPEGREEEIRFDDKRRFNDRGERVKVEVNDGTGTGKAESAEQAKSPEVVSLENALKEVSLRCEAAEGKLVEVQKRFEAERSKLESETSEMRERMKKTLAQRAEADRFNFLTALLPVLDNLNLAIEASERDSSFEHLLTGVKSTERSFRQALMNVGVEPVKSVGELFNPEVHEAVDMVDCKEEDEGKILAEYSSGYTFKGRLLRPARVQVGTVASTGTAAE
ncbi:MAG: nucleotide exchange factor GrpE [Acidobacteria bacterium]|nr:MAG: nucleotide exchange factor GrpE [Acidobacteriota bacterium]REK04028.1 MAG: nucleotide exchange factor GrpE [Acidobacteriota bacterium]REK15190.1 MAG: nucleotide exchange factor GrpE [Acidobacteriota bacterium]REK46280.1 MAG: nucleotide exchange factor GrpE [Acidobacteriota bacterium]